MDLMKNTEGMSIRVINQCFLLALFFVSTSTALTSVFVWLTYLTFPVALYSSKELREGLRLRPAVLAFALFILFILGTSWSIAPTNEAGDGVGKYIKLLLIPIGIALAWRDKTLTRRGIIYFMAGAAVLAFSSYLARFGLIPNSIGIKRPVDPTNAVVFKNHITTGIILGFAAVASFAYYAYAMTMRTRLFSLALGVFFAIPIIFLTQGRTGYVVLLVGLLTLSLLRFHANLKMLLTSILTAAVLFVGFYIVSDNFKARADHLVLEFKNPTTLEFKNPSDEEGSEQNSSGIRLLFYRSGLKLILEHPFLGSGTGSFQEGFSPIAKMIWPENHPFHSHRHQPHSELILIGVQLGAAGLILYLALMASLTFAGHGKPYYAADFLSLLCVVFFTSAIFNSLLWDVTEGHWFTLLAGCLYAQVRRGGAIQGESGGGKVAITEASMMNTETTS
jgi:O-antigen ligase